MVGLALLFALVLVVVVTSPFIWDYNKEICGMFTSRRLQTPYLVHWFGTDAMGRDVFARVCYGARYSLIIVPLFFLYWRQIRLNWIVLVELTCFLSLTSFPLLQNEPLYEEPQNHTQCQ